GNKIKDFLQSIVTESEHNEEECKAIEGLKSKCNL
ncbi:TPA: MerR family transcriptional regulator, partial [Haemophilus influenzae]